MTIEEAKQELIELANSINLIPSSKKGQAMKMALDAIEAQKIAKWIHVPSNIEQGEREFIWWKCSNCSHTIYSETEEDRLEFHRFCGRCGMMME